MERRRYALIGGGLLLYCGFALAFLARLPIAERGMELLPWWMGAFVLAVVGPAVLFETGIDAWPAVATVMVLFVTCLGLARVAWRRWPETEWFAVWLILAGVVWIGLTLLVAAVFVI